MHCGLGSAPEARRTRGQASPGALQAAWVKDSHDNEEHNDDQRDVDGPFYLQYSVRGQGRSCKKPSMDVIAMLQVMREHRIMQHDFMNQASAVKPGSHLAYNALAVHKSARQRFPVAIHLLDAVQDLIESGKCVTIAIKQRPSRVLVPQTGTRCGLVHVLFGQRQAACVAAQVPKEVVAQLPCIRLVPQHLQPQQRALSVALHAQLDHAKE